MIIVTAKCNLIDGKKDEFKKVVKELIEETRKENGCISYNLCEDTKAENVVIFIEEWESEEALNEHMKTKHFTRIVPQLRELQIEDSILNMYRKI